jgi:hypothetical protein
VAVAGLLAALGHWVREGRAGSSRPDIAAVAMSGLEDSARPTNLHNKFELKKWSDQDGRTENTHSIELALNQEQRK